MSTAVVLGVRIMNGLSKNNFCLSSSHSAPECYRQPTANDMISYTPNYTDLHRVSKMTCYENYVL